MQTHEGVDQMAQRVEHHSPEATFIALLEHGPHSADEALHILVHKSSEIERAQYLNAQPHKRTNTELTTPTASGRRPS